MPSYSWRISGVEPAGDPRWKSAPPEVRRAFWREVVAVGLEVKDQELARGLDRHGVPMVPIAPRTKKYRRSAMGPADPNAPPLTPAHSLSRTRSLLAGRAHDGYALFYWTMDEHTGKVWSRILHYHRIGAGLLPVRDVFGISPDGLNEVRDVFGISPDGLNEVRRRMREWWTNYKRGRKLVDRIEGTLVQRPKPKPVPPPAAPARPTVPKTKRPKVRDRWVYREIEAVHVEYHTPRPAEAAPLPAGPVKVRIWEYKPGRRKR